MDSAQIIDKTGDYWVVLADCGRRLYVREEDVLSDRPPFVGQTGTVGYVLGHSAVELQFIARDYHGDHPPC